MKSTVNTVWQFLARRRTMENVLDERPATCMPSSEKEEAVEQVERI